MESSKIREILERDGLEIPESLEEALCNSDEIGTINGVGGIGENGESAWYNWMIPKTIKGVPIVGPAILHDWEFFMGSTMEDFFKANRNFLNNLIFVCDKQNLIDERSPRDFQKAHKKCYGMFSAVDKWGISFFVTEANQIMIGEELEKMITVIKKKKDLQDRLGQGDMY